MMMVNIMVTIMMMISIMVMIMMIKMVMTNDKMAQSLVGWKNDPFQLQPSFIVYNLIKIHHVPGESRSVDVPKDKPAPLRSVHVLC